MLKKTAVSIAPNIAKLFNQTISSGTFPYAWKTARIVPIPKGGDRKKPANYRPISILPIISKLLEKHMSSLLLQHLKSSAPLSTQQWGFSSGKSTTTALVSFTHEIMQNADKGHEVCSLFFDLSKAFDKVPHHILINKLAELRVNPFLINWIHSYLSSRNQVVVLDGVE